MASSSCAICAEELTGQHPRYVLNFEQCSTGGCARRCQNNKRSAPLPLPGARHLRPRAPVPSDRPFSCHLCLSDAHGSSLGYFGSELCERCYHQMTSAQTKDRFTDGLVQLHTDIADGSSKTWLCDGCGVHTGPKPFVLPFFACSACVAREPARQGTRRSLLWGFLLRLPANLDIHATRLPDLFVPMTAAMLNSGTAFAGFTEFGAAPQFTCSACGNLAKDSDVYVINYALCAACRESPPEDVVYHFKGMFKRTRADGLPLQRYTSTQEQLGRGGFGDVYKVLGVMTKRTYAQKVVKMDRHGQLRIARGQEAGGLEDAFKTEARMLQRCCHPNIVETFEAWYSRDEGSMYMILEEAQHGDLQNLFRQRRDSGAGPLEEKKVWYLLSQIAAGLKYLHDPSIVHRDLKPPNVLLFEGEGGVVAKLTDFGLARQMSERVRLAAQSLQDEPSSASVTAVLTRFGGTPFYIAPEIMGCAGPYSTIRATRQSDIWSLGVLLWEIAYTCRGSPLPHPFRARGSDWQRVDYHSVPAQPTKAVPRSGFLQHLIQWMLSPEPRQRPSIDQVLREAKTVLQACENASGAART